MRSAAASAPKQAPKSILKSPATPHASEGKHVEIVEAPVSGGGRVIAIEEDSDEDPAEPVAGKALSRVGPEGGKGAGGAPLPAAATARAPLAERIQAGQDLFAVGKLLFDDGCCRLLEEVAGRGDGGPATVRLSGNEITAKSVGVLCSLARAHGWGRTHPMTWSLGDNCLDDTAAEALAGALAAGLVAHLDVTANELTAAALDALRLTEARNLRTLNLGCNDLGDDGAVALARALAEPSCPLVSLDISNTGVERGGLRLLAAAIGKMQRLKEIKVDDNECCDAVVELAMTSSLERLSLRNTGMSDAVAKKLSQQVRAHGLLLLLHHHHHHVLLVTSHPLLYLALSAGVGFGARRARDRLRQQRGVLGRGPQRAARPPEDPQEYPCDCMRGRTESEWVREGGREGRREGV